MKTENQVIEKFEKAVNELNQTVESLPDDPSQVSKETAQLVNTQLTAVAILGWVLDCDEEVQAMLSKINAMAKLSALAGSPADKPAKSKKR